MDFLTFLWQHYQEAMWYLGITATEYGKIGRFVNEFLLLMTFLTVRGIRVTKKQAIFAYLIIVILAIFIGIGLRNLNTVKISNELNNKENPELIKIQADIDLIKERLGI